MENQVDEIKHKLDIINVISKYMPLKKRGRHYLANCPFHGEKTPSFIVSPELQIFKCFGCGKAGDIFTFVQEYEKIDFREALETLAKQAGITLVQSAGLTQAESHKKRLIEINTHAARFYNYVLLTHPLGKPALDYVLGRGITMETIKQFMIGFSPIRNDSAVNMLLKKGYTAKELVDTGTFGKSNYGGRFYDRFQSRLIFPLFDYRDRVLGFSGRILPFGNTENQAKYINSPETDIYHKGHMVYGLNFAKEAIKHEDAVLVVEGEFDMISPFQLGVKHIVALKGTAFTEDQLQLLKRYTSNLILALDSDFAGNNAAKKSISLADGMGFNIHVLTLGDKYKDPDECVKADPDYFKLRLESTIPVWDYLINSSVAMYGTETDQGQRQIMAAVLPFITKIDSATIREGYYRKLASQLGTKEEALMQDARQFVSQTPNTPVTSHVSQSVKDWSDTRGRQDKDEEFLLTLIFGARDPAAVAKKLSDRLVVVTLPKYKNILDHLLTQDQFEPQAFAASLPSELQDIFQNLYLAASSFEIESDKRAEEISKKLNQLEIAHLRTELKQLSTKIAQLENSSDDTNISVIESEYNILLQKLSKLQSPK